MLSYAKSGTARTGDQLNGFKKGKNQQFNSGGVVKWAYFQKKVEYPFKFTISNLKSVSLENSISLTVCICIFKDLS